MNVWHFGVMKPLKEVLNFLLPMNIPIDESDLNGNKPFMKFMQVNNSIPFVKYQEMFDFLITNGASIDKADCKGVTPLISMMQIGKFDRAVQLLSVGANVNNNDIRGNFALKYAVIKNCIKTAKVMLETYKAKPNKTDKLLRTCLHIAIHRSSPSIDSDSQVINLLLDSGSDINAIDKLGRTPLHYAFVKIGDWTNNNIDPIEIITTLCSKLGINHNVRDKFGKTPLHYAAQHNSTICSIFLLNRGASLEIKDHYGNTPLASAFFYNHPDYAITLIERNADVGALVNPEDPDKIGRASCRERVYVLV